MVICRHPFLLHVLDSEGSEGGGGGEEDRRALSTPCIGFKILVEPLPPAYHLSAFYSMYWIHLDIHLISILVGMSFYSMYWILSANHAASSLSLSYSFLLHVLDSNTEYKFGRAVSEAAFFLLHVLDSELPLRHHVGEPSVEFHFLLHVLDSYQTLGAYPPIPCGRFLLHVLDSNILQEKASLELTIELSTPCIGFPRKATQAPQVQLSTPCIGFSSVCLAVSCDILPFYSMYWIQACAPHRGALGVGNLSTPCIGFHGVNHSNAKAADSKDFLLHVLDS